MTYTAVSKRAALLLGCAALALEGCMAAGAGAAAGAGTYLEDDIKQAREDIESLFSEEGEEKAEAAADDAIESGKEGAERTTAGGAKIKVDDVSGARRQGSIELVKRKNVQAPGKLKIIAAEFRPTTELNVRAGPGTEHAVVGGLKSEEPIYVIGRAGQSNWVALGRQTDDEAQRQVLWGYVHAHYIEPRTQTARKMAGGVLDDVTSPDGSRSTASASSQDDGSNAGDTSETAGASRTASRGSGTDASGAASSQAPAGEQNETEANASTGAETAGATGSTATATAGSRAPGTDKGGASATRGAQSAEDGDKGFAFGSSSGDGSKDPVSTGSVGVNTKAHVQDTEEALRREQQEREQNQENKKQEDAEQESSPIESVSVDADSRCRTATLHVEEDGERYRKKVKKCRAPGEDEWQRVDTEGDGDGADKDKE